MRYHVESIEFGNNRNNGILSPHLVLLKLFLIKFFLFPTPNNSFSNVYVILVSLICILVLKNGALSCLVLRTYVSFLSRFKSSWFFLFLFFHPPKKLVIFRTRRIGANPEKTDLVNFRGPDWRKFSELRVLLFFLGKTDKMLPKSRFSKTIFGHPAGSTKLDRPYCKQFWYLNVQFFQEHQREFFVGLKALEHQRD